MSNLLRKDVERSQWAKILVMGMDWAAWQKLPEAIRTGKADSGVEAEDMNPYDNLKGEDSLGKIFDQAMEAFYCDAPAPMLECYDFDGPEIVCDIGGGNGAQVAALLEAYPDMKGIVFDLPETIKRSTEEFIKSRNLESRCRCVDGNFFGAVPDGADIYMLRHILNNWDDESVVRILTSIATAMPEHGKLVVLDWVIRPDDSRPFNKWRDLGMFVFGGGAERTPEEHAVLFERAGLKYFRYFPAQLDTAIVEAVKA